MYVQADENGIKTVAATKSWRLIHNDGVVIDLAELEVKTETGGTTQVFVADTIEECKTEIIRLKLLVPERFK